MLTKPYKKLLKVENNRYYLLKVFDVIYLAIESIYEYQSKKGRKAEFTQGVRVLRVNSPLFYLFATLQAQEPFEIVENKLSFKEAHYEPIDFNEIKNNLEDVRRQYHLANEISEEEKASLFPFTFPNEISNATIMALVKEGCDILSVEHDGTFAKTTRLVRLDNLGNIRIYDVVTAGRTGFETVVQVNTFVLNRHILDSFMKELSKED